MSVFSPQRAVCSSPCGSLQRSRQTLLVRAQAVNTQTKDGYKVLIVGGGSAGITTAAHYARKLPGQVAVLEPSGEMSLLLLCFTSSIEVPTEVACNGQQHRKSQALRDEGESSIILC